MFELNLTFFIIQAIAIISAITVHEFAHAYTADRLGDPTPRLMGRVTLNPLAHLDPIGTVLIFVFGFGWGKPVLFDPFNLANPRKDSAIISFAGPLSNIILAIIFALIYHLLSFLGFSKYLDILQYPIFINLILAFFNLIPVYPLDGYKIVEGLLPERQAIEWSELRRYGIIFLFLLVMPLFSNSSMATNLIFPIVRFIQNILLAGNSII
ncbi:MAG: zinc metalloprotease [Patescibacteria group bacterium]|nr:MAG: zinc metalloprotease [Patescibacteria group bacterium]